MSEDEITNGIQIEFGNEYLQFIRIELIKRGAARSFNRLLHPEWRMNDPSS